MNITTFQIADDKQSCDIVIDDAAAVTLLRMWRNHDYQDFSKAMDISDKLTGAATEYITVSLADINATSFDGVYFLQAESPTEISLDITAELSSYKDCILNKVISANINNTCLVEINHGTLNAHALLVNLAYAISLQYIDEILSILQGLQIYCSTECQTCGGYDSLDDYTYRILNDPDIIVDGGEIV